MTRSNAATHCPRGVSDFVLFSMWIIVVWCDETMMGAFLLHLYQFTSLYCEGQNFGVFIARGLMDMR